MRAGLTLLKSLADQAMLPKDFATFGWRVVRCFSNEFHLLRDCVGRDQASRLNVLQNLRSSPLSGSMNAKPLASSCNGAE